MTKLQGILCAVLVAACGGGKSTPAQLGSGGAPADAAVAEEPDMPIDASGPILEVTHLEPSSGDAGTIVVIHGTAFTSEGRDVKVYFGAKLAKVTNVTDTEISVVAPKASAGDVVDVLVDFEPGGEVRLGDAFSYPEE